MQTFNSKTEDDRMSVYDSNGNLVFCCDQKTCNELCNAVSQFSPSFARAKIFDNMTIVLEHENKIGNLFQIGGDDSNEKRSGEINPFDVIELKTSVAFDANCLRYSSTEPEPSPVEYDFTKCFVRTALVQRYENTFPFSFYMDDSIHDDFSSDSQAHEKSDAKRSQPIVTEESEDAMFMGSEANAADYANQRESSFPVQRDIIYRFEHFFGQKESDLDVGFPHCIYSDTVNEKQKRKAGLIPIFGCTSLTQIENGLILTDFEISGICEKCIFFNPRHALLDVLKIMCRNRDMFMVGIRRISDDAEGPVNIFADSKIKKKFEAFVITETADRWTKNMAIDGFFCPQSVVWQAVADFQSLILPSISKTYDLTKFTTLPLSFYKSGVSFKDYDESGIIDFAGDTFERFEEYLNQDRHVKIQFKFSVVVFPKNHDENRSIMCSDV